MAVPSDIMAKRDAIVALAARHGAHNVQLFGSAAREEAGAHSDIDLLVEMEPHRGLLDHTALWMDLEALLGCSVDVVSVKALHHSIRERVLAEAVPL